MLKMATRQIIPREFHRHPLAQLPTPIEFMASFSFELEHQVWVKRDDMTGLELSGNKVRKLEYLLTDARQKGADMLITCGGVQSNHARATAMVAARMGLACRVLLRGQEDTPDQGNLLLIRLGGAKVQWCSPEGYKSRNETMDAMAEAARAEGFTPYVIPEGGSNALGALGYMNAVTEIVEQLSSNGLTFDTVACAIGSGGTYAGLCLGRDLHEAPFNVVGFNVCDSAEYFEEQTASIRDELEEILGLDQKGKSRTRSGLQDAIVDGYVGPGYGLLSQGCADAISDVAREEGVLLDPVYTGKAFWGMRDCLKKGDSRFGKRVLFLHTGGVFGLFPKAEGLADLLDLK
jgi:D-cysteine desulfhydrase